MSFKTTRMTNPDAIVVTLHEDFDFETEFTAYYRELYDALEAENSPISVIVDTTETKFNLADFLGSSRAAMQSEQDPNKHPNNKELVLVTQHKALKLSLDGFRKLGLVKTIHVADTLDEAIALIHGNQDKSASA